MTVYYNEFDKYAADWLRNLIAAGLIAPGVVDTRSIEDVHPDDLRGFTQCHFFAGVGVWSYALRAAGWPDDRPVWTGSCPCQPFSAAGEGAGFADERHLWPHFYHLIAEHTKWLRAQKRLPPSIFGEQVASKDADPWIDLVHTDLEALGYAFGVVPFPAAGVGAPHIRDRLYWVADAASARPFSGAQPRVHRSKKSAGARHGEPERPGAVSRMADAWSGGDRSQAEATDYRESQTDRPANRVGGRGVLSGGMADSGSRRFDGGSKTTGRQARSDTRTAICVQVSGLADDNSQRCDGQQICVQPRRPFQTSIETAGNGGVGGLADAADNGQQRGRSGEAGDGGDASRVEPERFCDAGDRTGPTNGFWRDADWLGCRDGKWRPVEPGTFPLAHGAAARVGRLRAYGNAINAEAARVFIEAVMEGA